MGSCKLIIIIIEKSKYFVQKGRIRAQLKIKAKPESSGDSLMISIPKDFISIALLLAAHTACLIDSD